MWVGAVPKRPRDRAQRAARDGGKAPLGRHPTGARGAPKEGGETSDKSGPALSRLPHYIADQYV